MSSVEIYMFKSRKKKDNWKLNYAFKSDVEKNSLSIPRNDQTTIQVSNSHRFMCQNFKLVPQFPSKFWG